MPATAAEDAVRAMVVLGAAIQGTVELEQGWEDGRYDVTWHCVECFAYGMHRTNMDMGEVAKKIDVYREQPRRRRDMQYRLARGRFQVDRNENLQGKQSLPQQLNC